MRLPPATSFFRNLSFTAFKETKLRHVIFYQCREKPLLDRSFETCQSHFLQLLSAFGTHTRDHLERLLHNARFYFFLLHSEFFQNRSQWDSSQWLVQPSAVSLCMIGPEGNQCVTLSVKFIITLSKCTCKQGKPILSHISA